jgi:hypothetical protein
LEHTWSILGAYLEYTWSILGAYLEHTWSILGVYLEHTWSIPGVYLVLSSHAVFADGTETLGTPSIKISTRTEVIVSGTGLVTQPATND